MTAASFPIYGSPLSSIGTSQLSYLETDYRFCGRLTLPSNTLQEKTELQACDKLGCKWKTGVPVGLWSKQTSLDII
jgi:hypothetical protein